ncbi:hypothetical protein ANCCAN_22470 [Ancylostoma caninum]|uniref:SCP domain-containing protein n=1 Tax=Ancylostoma caninum TaxID=29170 RepID=A0A368FLQ7_ANCCA|nr:hypothetical protein ANCCAN_22470 [Ancylostoma caninum]
MLSVAVLVLCISLSSAKWDCNEKIPIEMRKQIVKYQNDFRQKLLKGEVNGANGKLKPAKFMKNLDWSCDFEKEAESRCRNGIINTNGLQQTGAASDIIVGPGCYPKPLHFKDFKKAMDNWWRQAGGYTDNLFKDRRREEFAQVSFTVELEDFSQKDETNEEIKIFCEIRIDPFSEQCLGIV